jgi:hypothetical protein
MAIFKIYQKNGQPVCPSDSIPQVWWKWYHDCIIGSCKGKQQDGGKHRAMAVHGGA